MSEPKHTTGILVVGFYQPSPEFLRITEHIAVMKPTGELIAVAGKSGGKNEERSKADAQLYCGAHELARVVERLLALKAEFLYSADTQALIEDAKSALKAAGLR